MKIFLVIGFLFVSQMSFASELGCETTVTNSVSNMLSNEKSSEIVKSVTLVPQTAFSELDLFEVLSSSNGMGIMYSSKWAVVTRKGLQSTCTVESMTADYRAQ